MVFDAEDERERLVVELRRLSVRADVVEWVAAPGTDLAVLATAGAVPFWDAVLGRADPTSGHGPLTSEPLFALAVQAYLDRWRAEVEQGDLFEAAQHLARAARDHLSTRSPATEH